MRVQMQVLVQMQEQVQEHVQEQVEENVQEQVQNKVRVGGHLRLVIFPQFATPRVWVLPSLDKQSGMWEEQIGEST